MGLTEFPKFPDVAPNRECDIRSQKQFHQKMDFSGMCFGGGRHPTDIDGAIDFKGEVFIFYESKFGTAEIQTGQERFFIALCNAIERAGKIGVCIHVVHETKEGDIDLGASSAVRFYFQGKWSKYDKSITVREATDLIRQYARMNGKVID